MADGAPEGGSIFELFSKPGVKRDGTDFDSQHWTDGQWVRFQRGRPRKMGGYRALSQLLNSPVRSMFVDSREVLTSIHAFSQWGVEQLQIDSSGSVAGLHDRTPAGFVANPLLTWQVDTMFQSGGSGYPSLLAISSPDAESIASDAGGGLYSGDVTGTSALTQITNGTSGPNISVSGGGCVLQPFLFLYGSNGLIWNSNPNDASSATGWVTGGSNYSVVANVAGSKIVAGLPMRGGGQSPAGLFWALDSLIRVTFVGGTKIWSYDTVSSDTTILSKNCVVEYDNAYYWVGTDRFYVYNGIVQELPNQMNLNWFFDNLNFAQRNKVWALKVPRFGEIWWFYPSGQNTECDSVVIYNVREGLWYDSLVSRTAGFPAKVYPRPLMVEPDTTVTSAFTYTSTAGALRQGMAIVGVTSGATATISKATGTQLNVTGMIGTFINGETIHDTTYGGTNTGTVTSVVFAQNLATCWDHEYGTDKVIGAQPQAIDSYITTNNMTWVTGNPIVSQGAGSNYQMRLLRVEPDFIMSGSMDVIVNGKSYAQSTSLSSAPYNFNALSEFIDMREQRRELTMTFRSNEVGGTFQAGRILITSEPGDERG
jgi:hypothetical protein